MKKFRGAVRAYTEWLQILFRASESHPSEVFPVELERWFASQGENFDGVPLDLANQKQLLAFNLAVDQSLKLGAHAKFFAVKDEIPSRLYPNASFRLSPEMTFNVTAKGLSASKWSTRRLHIYVGWLLGKSLAFRQLVRFKVPIAVVSFGFSALKLVFQWDTIAAGLAATIAAALAVLAVALSPHN